MSSLGNDLATIRKKKDLSLEDVHERTKIPLYILKSIEDNSIFTESDENITYIRSYIRSYAKSLDIDDELIVEALDLSEIGTYSGFLLQSLTGNAGDPKPIRPSSKFETVDRRVPVQSERDTDKDVEKEEKQTDEVISDHIEGQPPDVHTVDWADVGRKFVPLKSRSKIWMGILFLVVIVATVIFFAVYENNPVRNNSGNDQTRSSFTQPNIIPDSLQVGPESVQETSDTASAPDLGISSMSTFSDTLQIVVYAAYGKLEPVRIYSDVMDNLYPYWIEQGQAYRYDFVNEIRIRGQYSRMELLFNGHLIDNFRQQFYNSDTRMLEINRSFFENDNKWLRTPPDSLPINAPPPQIVLDRPTFN